MIKKDAVAFAGGMVVDQQWGNMTILPVIRILHFGNIREPTLRYKECDTGYRTRQQ